MLTSPLLAYRTSGASMAGLSAHPITGASAVADAVRIATRARGLLLGHAPCFQVYALPRRSSSSSSSRNGMPNSPTVEI